MRIHGVRNNKNSGIEQWVITCMCLNYSEQQALAYLSDKGYEISARVFYRIKKQIQDSTQSRLNLIASEEWYSQHLNRLDMLHVIQNELIELAKKEDNPTKKANILMQLADIQERLTAYFDSTAYVLERGVKLSKKRKRELEQST